MSSAWTNAHFETSDQGISHVLKSPGAVVSGLTAINIAFVKFFVISYWKWLQQGL